MGKRKRLQPHQLETDSSDQDEFLDEPPDEDATALPAILPPPVTQDEMRDHGSPILRAAKTVTKRGKELKHRTISDLDEKDLQVRELGLGLSMFGLAEVYGERLQHMAGVLLALEKRVFSPEMLAALPPSALMEMYRLASQATESSAKFISGTLSTLNLDAIRARLVDMKLIETEHGEGGDFQDDPTITDAEIVEPTESLEGATNAHILESLHMQDADEDVKNIDPDA